MALAFDCRCGHAARRHFMHPRGGRAGACMDKACPCVALGPPKPEVPEPEGWHASPVTPPRRSF